MTLLILFLAMTNMAVGYGLAIYFGQGRMPIQITLGRFRRPKKIAASPAEEHPEQPAAAGDTTDSSAAEAADSVDSVPARDRPQPILTSEPSLPSAEEPSTSTRPPAPQLDLTDLMPKTQPSPEPSPESDDSSEKPPAAVAEADNATDDAPAALPPKEVSEPVAEASVKANQEHQTPDTDGTIAVDNSEQETVAEEAGTVQPADDVHAVADVAPSGTVDTAADQVNAADKQAEQFEEAEAAEQLASTDVVAPIVDNPVADNQSTTATEIDGEIDQQASSIAGVPDDEDVPVPNELESLAEQLQLAVAEADDDQGLAGSEPSQPQPQAQPPADSEAANVDPQLAG